MKYWPERNHEIVNNAAMFNRTQHNNQILHGNCLECGWGLCAFGASFCIPLKYVEWHPAEYWSLTTITVTSIWYQAKADQFSGLSNSQEPVPPDKTFPAEIHPHGNKLAQQ